MPLMPASGNWDQPALDRALALAAQAAAFTSPNPTVGCVLRRGDLLLGEGAHLYDQRDHAEIVALRQAAAAGLSVQGATAYVTLEPCSHHGRTGPCADALSAAGIARCVVATVDPNPLVRGSGLAKLRASGVAVEVLDPTSPQAQRARRLNDAFAFSVQHGRPFVTLKTALSRDGKLAPSPAARTATGPFWLTGPAARADVQSLRHGVNALLTGIGTVLADDPALTDRTGLPRRRPLLRVVLDPQLRLPPQSRLATAGADLLVFCAEDAPADRKAELQAAGIEVVTLAPHGGRLPLADVLAHLAGKQVRSVLLEAGSALNAAFLEADLVDKLIVYRAPVTLGPGALPFAGSVDLDALQRRLSSTQTQAFLHGDGEDLRLSGYLHDPWADLESV